MSSKKKMCLKDMNPTLIISLLTLLFHEVSMVKLASVRIPKYTVRGQPARLECHYDLEGEALYSVKWYKDDKEFYRFLPEDNPPAHIFDLPGLQVDLTNSSDTVVILKAVDLDGSGIYRCEVSGEAPSFKTVVENSQMVVVDLPDDGPHIEGGKPRYQTGEEVRVNCTSSRAKPAAKLSWQINGELAEEAFLRRYPIMRDENELETSILGLEFKVRKKHFKKRDLKIKCVATIEDFYWRTNEESVLEEHTEKSPALESKWTFGSSKREANNSSDEGTSICFPLTTPLLFFLSGILLTRERIFFGGRYGRR